LLKLERVADLHGIYIAVLEADGFRYGLVLDELLEPEEIVVKPLAALLRGLRLFSGATVLGNGTLALILDVAAGELRDGGFGNALALVGERVVPLREEFAGGTRVLREVA